MEEIMPQSDKIHSGSAKAIHRLSITEKLVHEKESLESRLIEVNQALEALAENPEIEKVLRLVSRVAL